MFMQVMIYMFISYFILVVFVLVSVAFVTLLERSVLGYVQVRSGPNKVSYGGLLQPLGDALKLFSKEFVELGGFNFSVYMISPILMLLLMLLNWFLYPVYGSGFDFGWGQLFFLSIMSVGVYVLMGCGWSSNSSFSLLGALRGIAQTISYEVSLALIILGAVLMVGSYDLSNFMYYQRVGVFGLILTPLFVMFLVSLLAETNRTPFDFSEGESELVSGFNVEYDGGLFAMLFMGEYGMILFMSLFSSVMFWGSWFIFYIVFMVIVIFFIWSRGTFPRLRYDSLMGLAWSSYLPVSLNYLVFCGGIVSYMSGF